MKIAYWMLLIPVALAAADEPYAGGPSPVSSSDPNRAAKAARRVKPLLTPDLTKAGLEAGDPIFIRIFKESAELELWMQPAPGKPFQKFRTYAIAYFSGRLGPKTKTGDLQAPEGFYWVSRRAMNPYSSFHLSFNLGYPNTYDRAHRRTGSALMVHGKNVSIGCYAMTDDSIEQIYTLAMAAFSGGQRFFRVHAFPFRMTAQRMERAKSSKNYAFWRNLREGYQAFEKTKIPPNIVTRNRRYVVQD